MSESESVRIGKFYNMKVLESESVSIGKCQNISPTELYDTVQNVIHYILFQSSLSFPFSLTLLCYMNKLKRKCGIF